MIDNSTDKQTDKTTDKIKRLEEIRREITEIFIELGNPAEVSADLVLSSDICFLDNKYAKDNEGVQEENRELIELANIPFKERTEIQTKRIYEIIDFKQDAETNKGVQDE